MTGARTPGHRWPIRAVPGGSGCGAVPPCLLI